MFADASLLIQAALGAQGVGLARRVLVTPELESGRLVRPFPETLCIDCSYYLFYPPAAESNPDVRTFRAWINDQAGVNGA